MSEDGTGSEAVGGPNGPGAPRFEACTPTLEEEAAKVTIDAVEIVLIDHRRGLDEPCVATAGAGVAAPLSANETSFLLCLADEEHPLIGPKVGQKLLRNVLLALALGKGDELDPLALWRTPRYLPRRSGSSAPSAPRRRSRGRDAGAKPRATLLGLEHGHVQIEVEPIDAVEAKPAVLLEDSRDTVCYGHGGLRSSTASRGHQPQSGQYWRRHRRTPQAGPAPLLCGGQRPEPWPPGRRSVLGLNQPDEGADGRKPRTCETNRDQVVILGRSLRCWEIRASERRFYQKVNDIHARTPGTRQADLVAHAKPPSFTIATPK